MKRFKVLCQRNKEHVIIQVDDTDAYLLRSYIWHVNQNKNGKFSIVRHPYKGVAERLSHAIAKPGRDEVVVHINNDSLDYRRSNLLRIKRTELSSWAVSKREDLREANA